MQLDIVHKVTAGSLAAVDCLDPTFDELYTPFLDNDSYFACNVDSEFFQFSRLVGTNQWLDVSPKKKV